MEIEESDLQDENADSSMRKSLEPAANMTHERAEHSEKHFWEIISTDEGMQMDESDQQL
jgi:hypothetical protein